MRALVTGGAGFIGGHIVDKLLADGHNVTVIDNESADSNVGFYWRKEAANHKIDICDYQAIAPLFKDIDWVFHLAAESRIQPTIINPLKAANTNMVGTCNILQAARRSGVKRVVYSSTSAAYGLKNPTPLREDMLRDCLNPYSVTKAAGEDLCQMYHKLFSLPVVIFRYFNVYGLRQPTQGQYAPVIGLFQRQKNNGKPMTIVGDGLQRRDFTNVKDVVSANILAATNNNSDILGELFNIGTGRNYSILQLVDMLGGESVHLTPRPAEARESLADNSKAEKLLKWSPQVSLDDWIKENYNETIKPSSRSPNDGSPKIINGTN